MRIMMTVLVMLLAQGALAQTKNKMRSKATQVSENYNRVIVDPVPVLIGGVGVAYEREINPNWTVGPYFNYAKLKNNDTKTSLNSDMTIENQIAMYGVRARFFVNEAQEGSAYFMGGLGMVDIQTEAQIANTQSGKASSSDLGMVGGAGYQFFFKDLFGSSAMILNLGGLVGSGYSVENSAKSVNKGPTEVEDPKAVVSLFLEASLGIAF